MRYFSDNQRFIDLDLVPLHPQTEAINDVPTIKNDLNDKENHNSSNSCNIVYRGLGAEWRQVFSCVPCK